MGATLQAIHPCVEGIIEGKIDDAFRIYRWLACQDDFLNYLLARRHLLQVIYAHFLSDVDYYRSITRDRGYYDREQTARSQAQSVNVSNAASRSDSVGRSRSDATQNGESLTTSESSNVAQDTSRGESQMDDVGYGGTRALTFGFARATRRVAELGGSRSLSQGFSERSGAFCNHYVAHQHGTGRVDFFYSRSITLNGSSEMQRETQRGQSDRRSATRALSRYSAQGVSVAQSDTPANENFNFTREVMDSRSENRSDGSLVGRSYTNSDSYERGRGTSWSLNEARGKSVTSSKGDAKSESESKMDSSGSTTSTHHVFAESLSQLAKHVMQLIENNEQLIEKRKKDTRNNLFAAEYLRRCAPDGFCPLTPFAFVGRKGADVCMAGLA